MKDETEKLKFVVNIPNLNIASWLMGSTLSGVLK
jgi:hypothetical protein